MVVVVVVVVGPIIGNATKMSGTGGDRVLGRRAERGIARERMSEGAACRIFESVPKQVREQPEKKGKDPSRSSWHLLVAAFNLQADRGSYHTLVVVVVFRPDLRPIAELLNVTLTDE